MKAPFVLIVFLCSVMMPLRVGAKQGAEEKKMSENLLIVPFGDIDARVLSKLARVLTQELGTTSTIAKPLEIPEGAYDAARRQYLSTRLLGAMRQRFADKSVRLLGVVDKDLYVPELNFVFGEADVHNRAAVISLVRLRQEYYGLPRDEELFFRRAITEAVHELGHTYGLMHCHDPHCVMFFSNRLADTDRKGYKFCERCTVRLRDAQRAEQSRIATHKPEKQK
jgi:archaemetzincin